MKIPSDDATKIPHIYCTHTHTHTQSRGLETICLEHEGKVQVLAAVPHVDVAVLWRHGHVVERQAQPQQAAEHTHAAGVLQLQAPLP